MTKLAAMPMYGKNPLNYPESAGRFPGNLVCSIWDCCLLQLNDDPGVTLTHLTARSNLVTGVSVRKK